MWEVVLQNRQEVGTRTKNGGRLAPQRGGRWEVESLPHPSLFQLYYIKYLSCLHYHLIFKSTDLPENVKSLNGRLCIELTWMVLKSRLRLNCRNGEISM